MKSRFTALTLIQWAWPIEIIITFLSWLGIVFFAPEKMTVFIQPIGQILTFIGAQAAVGFGGTPLKTKLENSQLLARAKAMEGKSDVNINLP